MKFSIIKNKIFLIFFASFLAVTALIVLLLKTSTKQNKEDTLCFAQKSDNKSKKEMRAVWVSFMDLSMKNTDYSENAFKEKFDKIVMDCKRFKMNSLIVHVRPFSDALYNSEYYPWSNIVSKIQ